MIPGIFLIAALAAPGQAPGTAAPSTKTLAPLLEVRVLDEQGHPLPEATVRVFAQPVRVQLTGPDGVARIPDLKPGTYRANAAKGGFRFQEATVAVPKEEAASLEFRLKPEA